MKNLSHYSDLRLTSCINYKGEVVTYLWSIPLDYRDGSIVLFSHARPDQEDYNKFKAL